MPKNIPKKIAMIAWLLSLLLAAAAISGCTSKQVQQNYITIGALLPLTGESSDEDLRTLNGLKLAKAEINRSGGILGKKLDIIVLDDRGDAEYIVKQYNILKERGVAAIIGSSNNNVTNALAKAAAKDGIPVISPTACHPIITQDRPNVFRAIFIDDYQAEVMAKFAYNSLNARTAVIMYGIKNHDYKQMCAVFGRVFDSYGGEVVAFEPYSSVEDFADILRKYISNPPDVIFCPENFVTAATLVNTAYKLNLRNTQILGNDAWDGLLTYVYPEAMNKVYYASPFSFDDNDPIVVQFVRDYFDSFSQMPLAGSATAYTCVYILAEAIKTAGSLDADAIISAMKTNEFNTITGKIRFDENNNPRINVYIIHIKDGTYSTYEKISA